MLRALEALEREGLVFEVEFSRRPFFLRPNWNVEEWLDTLGLPVPALCILSIDNLNVSRLRSMTIELTKSDICVAEQGDATKADVAAKTGRDSGGIRRSHTDTDTDTHNHTHTQDTHTHTHTHARTHARTRARAHTREPMLCVSAQAVSRMRLAA